MRHIARQPVPEGQRLHRRDLLASAAIAAVALLLATLVWLTTLRAVGEQRIETQARAERMLAAQAATLAEQMRLELVTIDQSLAVLQTAWDEAPDRFRLADWAKRLPALTAVTDDLFIADARQVIVQDILPDAVGQPVGAGYVNFPHGGLDLFERDGRKARATGTLVGETGQRLIEGRQYLMYLVRPLLRPAGWVIGASVRSEALVRLYGEASLGENALTALIDLRQGSVAALAGSAARRPTVAIAGTPMFLAMKDRAEGGLWDGPSAVDGGQRLHAFRRVPGRELVVVVAMQRAQALAPARSWATGAYALAVLATLLLLGTAGLVVAVVLTVRRARRRAQRAERDRTAAAALQEDLRSARMRAADLGAELAVLRRACPDAVAVVDADLRLVDWTPPFAAASAPPAAAPAAPARHSGHAAPLAPGLPLDEWLRAQARAGRFGDLTDLEAEVARRMGVLRGDRPLLTQAGPDGRPWHVRALPMPAGGLLLRLGPDADEAGAAHRLATRAQPNAADGPGMARLEMPAPALGA